MHQWLDACQNRSYAHTERLKYEERSDGTRSFPCDNSLMVVKQESRYIVLWISIWDFCNSSKIWLHFQGSIHWNTTNICRCTLPGTCCRTKIIFGILYTLGRDQASVALQLLSAPCRISVDQGWWRIENPIEVLRIIGSMGERNGINQPFDWDGIMSPAFSKGLN